jgi:hypothetical protein
MTHAMSDSQGSEGTSRLDGDAGVGAAGAAGAAGTDKAGSLTGSANLSNSASLDWREATAGYFRSVKDTVEEKLGAKDSGFAFVDKAEAGHQRGDYDRERADIELKCRSLMSPGSKVRNQILEFGASKGAFGAVCVRMCVCVCVCV